MIQLNSFLQALQYNSEIFPEKECYISKEERWTYGMLWNKIKTASEYIKNYSGHDHKHVIIHAKNTSAFLYIYPAIHLAHKIATPVDPSTPPLKILEIFKFIELNGSPALLISDDLVDSSLNVIDKKLTFRMIADYCEKNDRYFTNSIPQLPSTDSFADIIYTSGTTGTQKAVALTHKAHFAAVQNINKFGNISSEDIELISMPLCHSFALARMRCILTAGGKIVLVDGLASLKPFFKALKDFGVTGIGLVPAAWNLIYANTGNKITSFADQLRYLELGSALMTVREKEVLMSLLPSTHIFMHYGLTECSRATFLSFRKDKNYLDSVGKPAPLVTVKIISDSGVSLSAGEVGEICVNGPMKMHSYWKNTLANENAFDNEGWLRTGDLGSLNQDGYLFLHGRLKEMINVGGRKVFPAEIDKLLENLPAVKECVCVGIPDPRGIANEVIVACIVLNNEHCFLDEEEVKRYLINHVERYKIPSMYVYIQEIPRTLSGKIQRHKLTKYVLDKNDTINEI